MVDANDKVVAIALLTREDVAALGSSLKKVFFIDDSADFDEFTKALDRAEIEDLAKR